MKSCFCLSLIAVTVVLLLAYVPQPTLQLNNGVGLTPPMGYNSWYDLMCNPIMNETTIRLTADYLISSGLSKLGYTYVNLDDCWAKGRAPHSGVIFPDPAYFPSGIKSLADYVHSKSLFFGLYTDRGNHTCAGRPGSHNYEKIDAKTYASWGVDFVKEDSCYATQDHQLAFAEYATMRDALNSTGRKIYFDLCGWSNWYAPVGASLGNGWRIAEDPSNWQSILVNIDTNVGLEKYAGPGGWNNPSLLIGTDGDGNQRITLTQQKGQFSMWAIMASPLLMSFNVREMSKEVFEIYSNAEVIAVNQDKLGKQGVRLVGGDLSNGNSTTNVWGRVLSSEKPMTEFAMVFFNNGKQPTDITCNELCFAMLGVPGGVGLQVKDLWTHKVIGVLHGRIFTMNGVPANGGVGMYRLSVV